jgi:hypothetical protein
MKRPRPTATHQVLGPRALNRALLARQLLLERANMPPATAVRHLVGMQAQIPTDPYFGLWSRLRDFRPEALSQLIEQRAAVRIVVMRGTLHLVMADDALELRALVQPALTRILAANPLGRNTEGIALDRLLAAGRAAVANGPMTLTDLRDVLARQWPRHDPATLGRLFHYHTPLVQVPPRGIWGKGGAPRVALAEEWLGRSAVTRPSAEEALLRYLAAFGPASVMDAQAWAGITRLGPVFEALRPKLMAFQDEAGRELFDLPDAPRPDPETKAPPRFLPVYDNATLGFSDRDRIVRPNLKPPRPLPSNGGVRSFLIDGFVAGFWKIAEAKGRASLLLEPFAPLGKRDFAALAAEGLRLLKFASPEAEKTEVKLGEAY